MFSSLLKGKEVNLQFYGPLKSENVLLFPISQLKSAPEFDCPSLSTMNPDYRNSFFQEKSPK